MNANKIHHAHRLLLQAAEILRMENAAARTVYGDLSYAETESVTGVQIFNVIHAENAAIQHIHHAMQYLPIVVRDIREVK